MPYLAVVFCRIRKSGRDLINRMTRKGQIKDKLKNTEIKAISCNIVAAKVTVAVRIVNLSS